MGDQLWCQYILLYSIHSPLCLQLLVDGEYFADYDHSLPLESLNCLTVEGDIALYNLQVQKVIVLHQCLYSMLYRSYSIHALSPFGTTLCICLTPISVYW